MKINFMRFSILGGFGYNRCYRSVVEEGAAGGGVEGAEGAAGTEVIENEEKPENQKYDSKKFRGEVDIPPLGGAANAEKTDKTEKVEKPIIPAEEGTYKYNPVWDIVKSELHNEENPYDIPEELKTGKDKEGNVITSEKEFELLRDTIINNTDFAEGDTFLQEYLEAKESGRTADDFLKLKGIEANAATMSSDQKVEQSFKDYRYEKSAKLKDKDGNWKEGWTDDDIKEKIEEMSVIDKEKTADDFDNKLQYRNEQKLKKQINDYNVDFEKSHNKIEQENTQLVSNYLKKIEGKTTVAGIEFSEAEMAQYKKELPDFIKKEIKTYPNGVKYSVSKADELLQSILAKPEDSFELLPYLFMVKNNTLKGYSNRIKEKIKEALDKTLDNNPESHKGNAGVGTYNSKRFREGKSS